MLYIITLMGLSTQLILVAGLLTLTYILSLPLGYLRGKSRRYSFKWFLYIHIPIPFIILIRVISRIDYHYIPLIILAAVIGQFHGGKM